jgi:hypothetical protein
LVLKLLLTVFFTSFVGAKKKKKKNYWAPPWAPAARYLSTPVLGVSYE